LRVYVFRFRPSSHSDDYTLIATYSSKDEAKRAGRILRKLLEDMKYHPDDYEVDWDPGDVSVSVVGCEVWFQVYTAGYLRDIELALRKATLPSGMECYANFQELKIQVTVPEKLALETTMLVLDKEEAQAIKWLMKHCGKPKISCKKNGTQTFEWFYRGDGIYDNGILYLGGLEFDVEGRSNWEVSEVD
jgi:hypothetical protein